MVKKNHRMRFWHGMSALAGSLLVIAAGGYKASSMMEARINFMLGTTSSKVVSLDKGEAQNNIYFPSSFNSAQELVDWRENLNREIVAEGTVLLKNENATLPLSLGSNITMFGIGGVSPVYSGASGGGIIKNPDQIVTVTDAFTQAGFSINPTVHDWYVSTGIPRNCIVPVVGFDGSTSTKGPWENKAKEYSARKAGVTEADASEAFSAWKSSYNSYGDAAIVWICRYEGEGSDLPDGCLSLSAEEKSLIEEAKRNFKKVVVIVNSSAAVEIDALAKDPAIGAILWVSELGTHGTLGLADIIGGKAAPSGRLADTFAVSSKSSPAYQNSGAFFFANAQEEGVDYFGSTYVVNAEGIYVGYKYYETRYEDSVLKNPGASSKAGAFASKNGWNYSEEVTYPFGYGLSYTTFSHEIERVDVDHNAKTITARVKVTNTGDIAAKDVVELYAQSPYTEYDKANGVEKASVQLIGFAKTNILKANESQTVTIQCDMKYLASYDRNGAKTYILDDGEYYFAIGNGSHDALNNILAAKGYTTADGMDSGGDANLAHLWTNEHFDDRSFAYGATGNKITNLFDDADLNTWIPGSVTYLSRSDWGKTWPRVYHGIKATKEMLAYLMKEQYTAGESDTSSITTGSTSTAYQLAALRGIDFEDPLWDELLNQVTPEEMATLITDACEHTASVKSVQYQGSKDKDGPIGYDATFSTDKTKPYHIEDESEYIKKYNFASLCTEPTMAASFNTKLAQERGRMNAEDGLWSGFTVLWAPGANIHRTPYSGRNYEYFSEDSLLTNIMATTITKATQTLGAVAAPKHFAGNDQETNRNGVATFYTEQGFREIQLRGFEGAMTSTEGNAHCTMTAFNRIGVKQAAYSDALLTSLLRGEWGFDGYTITDFAFNNLMYPYASLTAGTDAFDNMISDFSAINEKALKGDKKLMDAARQATHRILYVYANSNAMNGVSANSKVVTVVPWWKASIIALAAVAALLAIISLVSCAMTQKNIQRVSKTNEV